MRPKPLTSGHSREGSGCRGWVRLQMLRDLGHLWLLDTSSFWKIIINSYFLFFMVLYAPQILEGLQNQRIMVGGGGGGVAEGQRVCSLVASMSLNWTWERQSHLIFTSGLALLSPIYSDYKQTWSFSLAWSLRTTVKRLFPDFSSQLWGLG